MPDHLPRLALLLALAAVALTPASATAYTGERPAPEFVQHLARKADAFWQQRNVPACASTRPVMMARSLVSTDGISAIGRAKPSTWEGGCSMWVLIEDVETVADPSWYGTAVDLCAVIYHEAGHTGGLEHSEHGLMSPYVETAPFECKVWARRYEARKTARLLRSDRHARR